MTKPLQKLSSQHVSHEPVIAARRLSAFSIIELLTVMAIMTIMLTFAAPALTSLTKSGTMNGALSEMAGVLSQARQYAVAQNTCVWVAMSPDLDPQDPSVSVVVLASKNGQDLTPWSDYGQVPNANIALLDKPRTFKQCRLEEAGTWDSSKIRSLPTTPTISSANSLAMQTAIFQIQLPGSSTPRSFDRVIQFLPDGQTRVAAGPVDMVEFGMRPMRGSVPDEQNVAILRINGLTGQTLVYRP